MIIIYGCSDDLVEVEGCAGAGEFNTDDWNAVLIAPGTNAKEQMRVRCYLGKWGCWQVAVGQVDEDVPFPDWPLRIRQGIKGQESAYSVVLELDAPEGTRLANVLPAAEES